MQDYKTNTRPADRPPTQTLAEPWAQNAALNLGVDPDSLTPREIAICKAAHARLRTQEHVIHAQAARLQHFAQVYGTDIGKTAERQGE